MNSSDIAKYLHDLEILPTEKPTTDSLKKRWKELCRKHHPDTGGNTDDFHRVTHAYKMLTDPDYRYKYTLNKTKHTKTGGDLNVRIQVPVSFEDAFFGRTISTSFNVWEFDDNFEPIKKEQQELVFIRVNLPAGCNNGFEHLVENRGHIQGDLRGDVMIAFTPQSSSIFRLEGSDVVTEANIPLNVMLKGGKIEVQTMYGIQTVKVPPGTQPGERLVLRHFGVSKIGSHIVTVRPLFPKKEELKGKEWDGLGIDWGADRTATDPEEVNFNKLFLRFGGHLWTNGTTTTP